MLYLDTLENLTQDGTPNQFVICHEAVKGLQNIRELTPAAELLQKWETHALEWEEFQQAFKTELRKEYGKGDGSRLRGLANYCIENDVTLYSPEPPGEQTYRAILTEVINSIWEQRGEAVRAVDKATELVAGNGLVESHRHHMEKIANDCEHFQPTAQSRHHKSCLCCEHVEMQIYACVKLNKPVIEYKWVSEAREPTSIPVRTGSP